MSTLQPLLLLEILTLSLSSLIVSTKRNQLFVLPSVISQWFRQIIIQAYDLKDWMTPFLGTLYWVFASLDFQHQAKFSQICKTATLSSVHTFFYQVDVQVSSNANFRLKVIPLLLCYITKAGNGRGYTRVVNGVVYHKCL